MRAHLGRIALLAMLMGLAGCGFHLRGSTGLDAPIGALSVAGLGGRPALADAIAEVASEFGAVVFDQTASGTPVLDISGEGTRQRVTAVDSNGYASEYELTYILSYSANGADGKPLLPVRTVSRSRTYAYDASNVMGSGAEANRTTASLRREALREVFRRLAVALSRGQK